MTSPENNETGNSEPPQSHKNNTTLWLIAGVVALLAAGLIGYLLGHASGTQAETAAEPVSIAEVTTESVVVVTATALPTDSPATGIPASPTAVPTDTAEPPTATPAVEEVLPEVSDGDNPLSDADLTNLYTVWELLAAQYDGEVPPVEDILDAAIAGSVETLDDNYTRYVPADLAERIREDMTGAVEGIGAFVRENEEGLFEIVRPIEGQPADLAGIEAGDVVVEVDGKSMIGVNFDEVILLVRGPEGTTVNLKVAREGEDEPLEFDIVRTRFEVPVVESEMLPDEMTGGVPIGYVRLTEFTANADERLREALQEILAQNPQGLVFDLRDNPGGYLDQSVAVADAFLPDGVALFERNIRGLDETFATDDGDLAESIPMVVLVNAASASASEIVAGALQDRDRAEVVGETSFGKGSVQQIYTLSDGSDLRVTIARWYTPDNHSIDKEGITPDIEVESPEAFGGMEDGQLLRAVEFLLTGQ
ncbi:MAG: S41 family peptidase [Chloroflexota bacterium]